MLLQVLLLDKNAPPPMPRPGVSPYMHPTGHSSHISSLWSPGTDILMLCPPGLPLSVPAWRDTELAAVAGGAGCGHSAGTKIRETRGALSWSFSEKIRQDLPVVLGPEDTKD